MASQKREQAPALQGPKSGPPRKTIRGANNALRKAASTKRGKLGNLKRAANWCHDAGAPGVCSPAWIIVGNLELSRSTAGAKCPRN